MHVGGEMDTLDRKVCGQDQIAVASNAPFSEWGQTFTDPRLAAAVVDRLTFRAHILETGTSSYRLRTSRAKRKEAPPAA